MANTVMTPIGILCFADGLFKPKPAAKGSDKLRYSCILLFNESGIKSTAYENLKRECHAAIVEKWGAAKAADQHFLSSLRRPFRMAAEKDYAGFDQGEVYISPWCNPDTPPGIVNVRNERITVESDVYSGQWARATVRPFGYDSNGNKGVGLYLEHVQIVKDGKRLDGRQEAEKAFANADNSQLAALGIDLSEPAGGSELPW